MWFVIVRSAGLLGVARSGEEKVRLRSDGVLRQKVSQKELGF